MIGVNIVPNFDKANVPSLWWNVAGVYAFTIVSPP